MSHPRPHKSGPARLHSDVGLTRAASLDSLNAVRLIVVSLIGIGYASTMSIGPQADEWLHVFGYNPSLFGLQVLFCLSGWLAMRSLSRGATITEFILSRARRTLPILALYTAVVVVVLYPVLCDHDAPIVKGTSDLLIYFLKTVTLIAPGQPMPGALDNALYACVLQGAVWSLRWGAIAYAGLLILQALKLRRGPVLLILTISTIALHTLINHWADTRGTTQFDTLITATRLGFPFLMGVTAYAYRYRLPSSSLGWAGLSAILLGMTALHYYVFEWSYLIEILAASGWCALALAALHSQARALQNWPNWVLPLYLGIWPLTQLILWAAPTIDVPTLVMTSMLAAFVCAACVRGLFALSMRPIHRRIQSA